VKGEREHFPVRLCLLNGPLFLYMFVALLVFFSLMDHGRTVFLLDLELSFSSAGSFSQDTFPLIPSVIRLSENVGIPFWYLYPPSWLLEIYSFPPFSFFG